MFKRLVRVMPELNYGKTPSYTRKGGKAKLATGVKQSNTGGRTLTRTTTKRRKRKTAFNVVKEVKKLKKKTAIERNKAKCTYTRSQLIPIKHTHIANSYGNSIINVGTVADAEAALQAVKAQVPGTGEVSYTATNASMKTHIRFYQKIYMKNNDNFPTNVCIYVCTATENHNRNIQQIFDDYHIDVPAGNDTAVQHRQDLRHNLGDVRNMPEYYSLKRTHVYLKPGDEYTFYVNAGGIYDPSINDTETVGFLKGFSKSIYVRTYGVPCHDSSNTNLVGTTPLNQMDIVRWEYEKVVFNGIGNTKTRRISGLTKPFGDLGNQTNPVINGIDVTEEGA